MHQLQAGFLTGERLQIDTEVDPATWRRLVVHERAQLLLFVHPDDQLPLGPQGVTDGDRQIDLG